MKLFGRYFVFPIYVAFREPGVFYSDTSEHLLVLRLNRFYFHICPLSRSGGTFDTTSLYFQFGVSGRDKKGWHRQLTLCWRPDVTHYNWNKQTFFERKRKKS